MVEGRLSISCKSDMKARRTMDALSGQRIA